MKIQRLLPSLLGAGLLASACQAPGPSPALEAGDPFARVTLQFES